MKKNGFHLVLGSMNNGMVLKSISMVLILVMLAASACNDDNDSPSVDSSKPGCQLTSQTSTTSGKYDATLTYTLKVVWNYGYDDAGNLTSESGTYNYTFSDGKSSNSTSSTSYQYDDKGFMTRSLRQYSGTDKDGKSSTSTSNEDYTYEKERLVKDAVQSTSDGKANNYSFQYEYDDAGKIIKYSNTYNNSSTTFEYSGTIVQKITTVDGAGNSTSPFVQFNAQGFLIKSIQTYGGGQTDENRYEFNSENLITKYERYINSKPSSGSTSEFDTKESPFTYIYGKKKGFPTVPSTQAEYLYKHNNTATRYLTANAALTAFEGNGSTITIYDYNTKNFPTGSTAKSIDGKGVETNSSITTYQYSNCQ